MSDFGPPAKETQIKHPTETVITIDSRSSDTSQGYFYSRPYTYSGGACAYARHGNGNKLNVLWGDGHVTTLVLTKATDPATGTKDPYAVGEVLYGRNIYPNHDSPMWDRD
jgi:prepilin-type processing-associated H-X9-DG protein